MISMKINLFVIGMHFIFGSVLLNAQNSTPLNIGKLKEVLNSESETEREKAIESVLDSYPKLKSEDQKRVSLIICEILAQKVSEGEVWDDLNTSRNTACYIAGKLSLEVAIPYLIDLLKPKSGQILSNIIDRAPFTVDGEIIGPAAKALIKIGSPAKQSLQKTLDATKDEGLKKIIKYILKRISVEEPEREQERKLQESEEKESKPPK